MNDDIKSAREIALEKAAKISAATPEERLKWQYVPEGERLGVKYLNEDLNLIVDLQRYPENVRQYINEGAEDILIRNINLPKDDGARKSARRAMDGLKILKRDKAALENVYSKLRRIFNHYAQQGQQQKQEAYETLKVQFAAKLQEAIKQQTGTTAGYKIDVERQPQFQEEWRRVQAQLDLQYIKLLDEYKLELKAVP